jgi:rhombotail lipoprotein
MVILLSACSSKDMRPQLERGMGGIPTTRYSDAQTVEEIRKLRPQAEFPLNIAVMPPSRWDGLSQPERDIIERWGEDLKKIGFVESLQIVPKSLVPKCGYKAESECFLTESWEVGVRLGADAILFLNDSTVTDSYVNPLSILNLTIVGMWGVLAHHRDAYSIYEASLFDIDNGYLYLVAEGHGEQKSILPYMYAEYNTGQEEARIKALNDVGGKLFSLAKEQMNKLSSPNSQ